MHAITIFDTTTSWLQDKTVQRAHRHMDSKNLLGGLFRGLQNGHIKSYAGEGTSALKSHVSEPKSHPFVVQPFQPQPYLNSVANASLFRIHLAILNAARQAGSF